VRRLPVISNKEYSERQIRLRAAGSTAGARDGSGPVAVWHRVWNAAAGVVYSMSNSSRHREKIKDAADSGAECDEKMATASTGGPWKHAAAPTNRRARRGAVPSG
jgi:hypothetical protein